MMFPDIVPRDEMQMKFPAQMSEDDMVLSIKEWKLSGLSVKMRTVLSTKRMTTDLVYIYTDSSGRPVASYIYLSGRWLRRPKDLVFF